MNIFLICDSGKQKASDYIPANIRQSTFHPHNKEITLYYYLYRFISSFANRIVISSSVLSELFML
jgi:hypothetical protein